ncbi:hypothetical protein SPLC1_S170220 [Arthrospira platensis C1]|nr:hypothetical protein SPLC1_S170220 [Arthrospira platensis C1]
MIIKLPRTPSLSGRGLGSRLNFVLNLTRLTNRVG